MMKRGFLTAFLFVLYVLAFAVGSFLRPFGATRMLGSNGLVVRLFIWDGVLLMLGLYLLTLGIAVAGKRLRELAPWTTASVILAGLLGYLLRFGFVTREF